MANEQASTATGSHELLCPTCRVGLVMSERQGIEIDYCPKCRGVWLDRGELDKIIERSLTDRPVVSDGRGYAPERPVESDRDNGRFGRGDRHGGGHHGSGRRESFLGRLFD